MGEEVRSGSVNGEMVEGGSRGEWRTGRGGKSSNESSAGGHKGMFSTGSTEEPDIVTEQS